MCLGPHLDAQRIAPRITSEITNSELSLLKGSLHPLAQAQFDAGRLAADTKMAGVSIVFNRSAAQQADLEALMAAQQNPASPLYHQWLTPDQFAARFGMADNDLDKVEQWLQQQGFSIDSVARSKNVIRFSGTVSQVEFAFSTQMHHYTINGAQHFAASTELTLPAAIAPVVLGIGNLDDFRPQSHVVMNKNAQVTPNFTSSQTGSVYFAPGDIATVYDINPVYNEGYDGTGQSIAIVGQSAIALSDITNFQTASGHTAKDPNLVLMPGTGSSTIVADGDEGESDLDLEWSNAIAPGASIYFVYTGSNTNYGAFDAIEYAIDQKIAPIISSSYGTCEADLGTSMLESVLQQASTQGQTVLAAAGDNGSTDCFGVTGLTATQQKALAVDFPASSPYVTGMGGTETSLSNSAYLTAGDGYWEAKSSSDVISSALQYIPEQTWNEDVSNCGNSDCLSAGGGGASSLFVKPSWQTGVPGIPNDGRRDVPDIALSASTSLPGYLVCSSDKTFWHSGQVSSCSSGFRDASSEGLTVLGGTSFGGPIFAGMLALINQQHGYTSGQGLINPALYTIASNSAIYASAFHDITTGNNDCLASSTDCSSDAGFPAGVGYDQTTGLGTIDLYNLSNAWPGNTGTGPIGGSGTGTFSLAPTPATLTVSRGSSGTETINLTPSSGYMGTVVLSINTSNNTALADLCYQFTNMNGNGNGTVTVTGTEAAATELVLGTDASECSAGNATRISGKAALGAQHGAQSAKNSGVNPLPGTVAFAGLLLAGYFGRGSKKFRSIVGMIALVAVGLALSGCNSISSTSVVSSTPATNPPAGTYTITVTGQDSTTPSITSSTSFTFVIQ